MMSAIRTLLLVTALLTPPLDAQPKPPTPPSEPPVKLNLPSKSWLGVGIVDVNQKIAEQRGLSEAYGVEVGHVADDSPASEAGIEPGDVITSFRGEKVLGVEHFARLVRETPAGREVELGIWTEEGRRDVAVTIGLRRMAVVPGIRIESVKPEPFDFDLPRPRMVVTNRSLGAELESLEGQLAAYFGVENGVLVRNVDAATPAARSGLRAGDVIVEVDGESVASPAELRRAIGRADQKKIALTLVRKGARRAIEVDVPQERSFGSPFRSPRISRTR